MMIGTGTGVAPFIGMIEEKSLLKEESNFGYLALIFGCRKSKEDYIVKKFADENLCENSLNKIMTAFSQDGV